MTRRLTTTVVALTLLPMASADAQSTDPQQASTPMMVTHNGSLMEMLPAPGGGLVVQYAQPRPDLKGVVMPGTVLVRGHWQGPPPQVFVGEAFVFSRLCGAIPYRVRGTVDQSQVLILFGGAPQFDTSCRIVGYDINSQHATLRFEPTNPPPAPVTPPVAQAPATPPASVTPPVAQAPAAPPPEEAAKAPAAVVKVEPVTIEDHVNEVLRHGGKDANPQVAIDGDVARIRYSIQPWAAFSASSTEGIYGLHVATIVPKLFEKVPELNRVEIVAHGSFRDRRGNDTVEDVLRVSFTRRNAEAIKWNRIRYSDAPSLADRFWRHPGFHD
jgi:hypothetical protein